VNVAGVSRKVVIWDTAGQERFRSITETYFKGSDGAMIVYDVTAQYSFEALPDWVHSIREKAGARTPLMIIGNKCDLDERVPRDRAEDWAASEDLKIVFVSALTGDGVELSLQAMMEAMVKAEDEKVIIQREESIDVEDSGQSSHKKKKSWFC
jgi:small GTP-binding protein